MPAPQGNQNAMKHGLYARHFRQAEISALEGESGERSLAGELEILRIAILRTFEQAQAGGEDTNWADYLADIGLAATRVASLLRTQKLLEGEHGNAVQEAIRRAIETCSKDWK